MRTFTKVSARLATAFLAVASIAMAAQAQGQSFSVRMNVPFAFQTNSGQHFQPGVYTISNMDMQTMVIRGATANGLTIYSHDILRAPVSQGKAIFARYGDKYYLHSVSATGSSTRVTFKESREEQHLQKARAYQSNKVELALLQAGR